jgi:hypothetical protein
MDSHSRLAAGAIFLIAEQAMMFSVVSRSIVALLMRNPKMTVEHAKKCVPMVVTRILGFVHNAIQVRNRHWLAGVRSLIVRKWATPAPNDADSNTAPVYKRCVQSVSL